MPNFPRISQNSKLFCQNCVFHEILTKQFEENFAKQGIKNFAASTALAHSSGYRRLCPIRLLIILFSILSSIILWLQVSIKEQNAIYRKILQVQNTVLLIYAYWPLLFLKIIKKLRWTYLAYSLWNKVVFEILTVDFFSCCLELNCLDSY